jgi:hypothetical protein
MFGYDPNPDRSRRIDLTAREHKENVALKVLSESKTGWNWRSILVILAIAAIPSALAFSASANRANDRQAVIIGTSEALPSIDANSKPSFNCYGQARFPDDVNKGRLMYPNEVSSKNVIQALSGKTYHCEKDPQNSQIKGFGHLVEVTSTLGLLE